LFLHHSRRAVLERMGGYSTGMRQETTHGTSRCAEAQRAGPAWKSSELTGEAIGHLGAFGLAVAVLAALALLSTLGSS